MTNFSTTFKKNDVTKGIVTSIKNYGVFLSFDGGYIGLLHISEISPSFINNIYNCFKIGQEITVLVKSIDLNTKFLSVSIKDLPKELNKFNEKIVQKRATSYLNEIDFLKLEKALPQMISDELERINYEH